MSAPSPRVTVCVPTRNRAARVPRTLESILAQDWSDLELVVGDNASTDATPEVTADMAARDPRVRVVRRPHDLGLTGNFNALLSEARGDYVMVLADDDWIGPGYIRRCVAELDAHPECVIASGHACFHDGDAPVGAGTDVNLVDDDPERRVRRYFGEVRDNATIYGLMRRAALQAALPMRNCLAGDWLLVGRLAMVGTVRTVPDAVLHRSAAGTSASFERTVRSLGLTAREARYPHLSIASFVYADIARDAAAYEPLGPRGRRRVAAASAAAVLRARPFDVVADAVAPLMRRPRLRAIDAAVRPVVRRLQR